MLSYIKSALHALSKFERLLWASSVTVLIISFSLSPELDFLVLAATLTGITALVFTAKGDVIGQILIILFAILYATVSFKQALYGEMISYIFMSGGIATFSTISWLRHPYAKNQVKINTPTPRALAVIALLSLCVSVAFYFILRALGTASLAVSTFSMATSFIASSFTLMRYPIYALAYSVNDIVLIVLWTIASFNTLSAIPMVVCFVIFLVNDLYGFTNWLRMAKIQRDSERIQ